MVKPKHQQTQQKPKGLNFYTDQKKLKQKKLLNSGKIVRDRDGKFVSQLYQERKQFVARVESNRKWFENTRTISQKEIQELKEVELKSGEYLLRELPKIFHAKAPTSAIKPDFQSRKKPKLKVGSIDEMVADSNKKLEKFDGNEDEAAIEKMNPSLSHNGVFLKGQSKRIWSELYKVIDSSDVILHVLDSRDPMGTKCVNVLKYLREEKRHKNVVFILNKCDLVPVWVTQKWKAILEQEHPTIAFHASVKNPFGKSTLINLLRQFSKLHSDKKQISVGLIGYPNVGKSSLINTLKQKKVCNVAPIPGETKNWQYVTLMKRIYLIDCPGVVYSTQDSESDIILKGVVRVENVENTEDYISSVLERCRPEYLERTYGVSGWSDHFEFLKLIAEKSGKLLKGGEPDLNTVSKMILNDWIRGKIPFYTAPPEMEGQAGELAVKQKMGNIKVSADFSQIDRDGVVANSSQELVSHENLDKQLENKDQQEELSDSNDFEESDLEESEPDANEIVILN
jgi:nuclear GTP-binding protein